MFASLKKALQNKCPVCQESLVSQSDSLCITKSCPHGHFKEENYSSLGVRLLYHNQDETNPY